MKKYARYFRNYYLLFCIVEFIFLLIGCFQITRAESFHLVYLEDSFFADTEEGRLYRNFLNEEDMQSIPALKTEDIRLPKGIYEITLSYESTNGGNFWVTGDGHGPRSFWAEQQGIDSKSTQKTLHIWANDPLDWFSMHVSSNGGVTYLKQLKIEEAANSRLYQKICLFLKLALFNGLVACYYYRQKLAKYSVEIVGILGITFVASLGMLTRYVLPGHDLLFHLLRIEGLKEGLLSGSFPVRIQPNWCNGWGYAVSVMYGDTTLILPAVMRMIGFTVQTSYKTFVIGLNFLTALASWYSFREICKDSRMALFGSFLYTTAPYRLCCIYTRGAFGEYTAMLFLPLVLLGFWYAFGESIQKENYGKKLLLPIIGLAGLIQTHILTCQMAALFILALCLIEIKKLIRIKTFLYLMKMALFSILLSLWFLVPFLQYFREDLNCTVWKEMAADYQILGVSLTELFAQEASSYYGYSWSELTSLADKFSIPLGNGLLLCIPIALLALWNHCVGKKRKIVKLTLVMGTISVWLATNLFPYHFFQQHMPKLASFLAKPGLPYRYLSIAGLLLSLLGVLLLWQTGKKIPKWLYVSVVTLVMGIAVHQSLAFTYQILYAGYSELYYDGNALNTNSLMGNEYLYQGTETWIATEDRNCSGENINMKESRKNYNRINVSLAGTGDNAFLEVPMFYYPGYVAVDENGNRYEAVRGNNNRIRVYLPAQFSGELTVAFHEPVLWRIAEILSVLTAAGGVFWYCLQRRNRYRRVKAAGTAEEMAVQAEKIEKR